MAHLAALCMWRVGIGYRMQPRLRQSLHVAAERIDRKRVRVALVADGAAWVWNALEECFPEGRCILDYYHCAEHVWGAADALHGEGTSEAREWAEAFLTELCLGKVGKSIAALTLTENQTALQTEALENPATYLEHQTRRIHYIDDIDGGVSETVTNGLIGIYSCVLVGISYHLHTFSIPRAFSGGIRPRNAVWSQLGVKLTQYSRQIYMTTTRGDP